MIFRYLFFILAILVFGIIVVILIAESLNNVKKINRATKRKTSNTQEIINTQIHANKPAHKKQSTKTRKPYYNK